MKIKIVTKYCNDDTEFMSDYLGVDVYVDDPLVRSYGDYYHDKGDIRAESFVEGLTYGMSKKMYTILHEKINFDQEYC